MLSGKLIQLIEDNWDRITTSVIHEVRADSRLVHIRKLPESELREVARNILRNVGYWLSSTRHQELEKRYEGLGRLRFVESIPLHEVVHALQLVKSKMLDFVRDQGFCTSPVDIYAEEELEHQVGLFFDDLIYYIVRGYEGALRQAAHMTAAV